SDSGEMSSFFASPSTTGFCATTGFGSGADSQPVSMKAATMANPQAKLAQAHSAVPSQERTTREKVEDIGVTFSAPKHRAQGNGQGRQPIRREWLSCQGNRPWFSNIPLTFPAGQEFRQNGGLMQPVPKVSRIGHSCAAEAR